MSCFVVELKTKCFFGRGKKNLTVTWRGQPGLSLRIVALAFSIAFAKAEAKDFWFDLLGLNILGLPALPLVVAKLRAWGRGMPSILHLRVLQWGVVIQETAEDSSNVNSVFAHLAVWFGLCFVDGFAAAAGWDFFLFLAGGLESIVCVDVVDE